MKIKANVYSSIKYRGKLDVYIDGVLSKRCVEADEQEGTAWVMRERGERELCVAVLEGKPGDFVCDAAIVDRVVGKVELRFALSDDDPSEDEVRKDIAEHYQPVHIMQIVQ